MATFETRFDALFLSLETVMECPQEFKETLKELMKKAGFDALPAASSSSPSLPELAPVVSPPVNAEEDEDEQL